MMDREEIYSKALRAGRRTYFFDVRSTRAGDYYLNITESKKYTNDDGTFNYRKHKIFIYKEDFEGFKENLIEMFDYIVKEKGEEVISDRHQRDYNPISSEDSKAEENTDDDKTLESFSDIDIDKL